MEVQSSDEGGPRRLGDFVLLEEIGRGGMGVVYKARQVSLDRIVALKVLPRTLGMDPDAVARFRREAESAGRLAHPGIVPIYGVWEDQGVHYFAMELVDGPSLHAVLLSLHDRDPAGLSRTLAEETALSEVYPGMSRLLSSRGGTTARYARSCAALIMEVAESVGAAHAAQVIHRDLKPSNILLHPSGRAVVVDFGLVWDPMNSHITRTGDAVGTPSYMAPEQAAGERDLDERVDVYGLGATLYELLTLRPPFSEGHAAEIMQAILDRDPVPVRKINPRVPRDLAAIVHKCLRKRPEQRYRSAEALSSDLRAFLEGRPVSARPPRGRLPFRRWLRRRSSYGQAAALAIGSTTVLAVLAAIIVRDSAERRGLEALEEARARLGRDDPRSIQEAYGRAAALLGERKVVEERKRHLAQVFEDYYRAGRFAELEELLRAIPERARGLRERAFAVRLRGEGVLKLEGLPASGDAQVRYRTEGGSWQEFPPGGRVPIGDLEVEVLVPGYAPTLHRVRVGRDRVDVLPVALRPDYEVPEGMVLVPADAPWGAFAVSRAELTAARYLALLRGVDNALRDELQPLSWRGAYAPGDPGLPVVGLTFQQARLAAGLLGGHLPSAREFALAGGGALPGHDLPWGRKRDPARLIADPSRYRGPVLAESMEEGASPYGVLHLLGNAAEFLAARDSFGIRLAGGYYGSAPDLLSLSFVEDVAGPQQALPYAGVRVYRFLPPAGIDPGPGRWSELREGLLADAEDGLWARWEFTAKGLVEVTLTSPRTLPRVLAVPGFTVRSDRSRGRDRVLQLLPLAGLHGSGDGYAATLPHRIAGRPVLGHEVHLPPATVMEGSVPEPEAGVWHEGRLRLLWTFPPGTAATTGPWARLRKDGLWTKDWPAAAPVREAVREFFAAFGRRSTEALSRWVTRDFEYRPAQWFRIGDRWSRGFPDEVYRGFELRDWTAVGDVVCAEVVATWVPTARDGTPVELRRWPLHLFLVRQGEAWKVRCVEVATRPDGGLLDGSGYRHPGLGLEIAPAAGERLWRRASESVPLQVDLIPAEAPPDEVLLRVVGAEMSPGESALQLEHRLSRGELSTRPGELRTGRATDMVGSHESGTARAGRSTHWLFEDRDGGFRRERWTVVQAGGRGFLLRASARGRTRAQAEERYRRWEEWFDGALQRVDIR